MSILKKIFSSAAGDLVNSVGGVIDNLVTTDDERLAARAKIKQIVLVVFRQFYVLRLSLMPQSNKLY